MARQRGVAALSELMNIGVGTLSKDLGLEDGSPAKPALRAAVGALTALGAGRFILRSNGPISN
jgi:filamentous hemagglutinin